MNQMFRLRDDYDDDDDNLNEEEESQAPSQARAASVSLHSSDTMSVDDDDDEIEDNNNNANRMVVRNERMARRILRNAGAGAGVNNNDDDDDARIVVRMLQQQPVGLWAATAARPGGAANAAAAAHVVKQPSWWQRLVGGGGRGRRRRSRQRRFNIFCLVVRLVQWIMFKIDAVMDGMWHGVQALRREFQTSPFEIPFFDSTASVWYILCIIGAVHCLGMIGLAQYYYNHHYFYGGIGVLLDQDTTRKIDHWCTLVTCAALMAVALPTMSAPGVLTRCHVSAWLVFVGAVVFAVGVDQEFIAPLSFTKEYCLSSMLYDDGAAIATQANVWQLLDINKAVQWMVLSFLGLLPHALGSTSSAPGTFGCFVLGWCLSESRTESVAETRWNQHGFILDGNLYLERTGVSSILCRQCGSSLQDVGIPSTRFGLCMWPMLGLQLLRVRRRNVASQDLGSGLVVQPCGGLPQHSNGYQFEQYHSRRAQSPEPASSRALV
jgi:hypothetical protein